VEERGLAESSSRAPAVAKLYPTKNDLPEASRIEVITLLNQRLADAIDLQTQCKQAHWNVKGRDFIALHQLFDKVNESVEEYIDLIAERVETETTVVDLLDYDVRFGQGFLFSPPRPVRAEALQGSTSGAEKPGAAENEGPGALLAAS
jgi:hypothetical protein